MRVHFRMPHRIDNEEIGKKDVSSHAVLIQPRKESHRTIYIELNSCRRCCASFLSSSLLHFFFLLKICGEKGICVCFT